MNRHVILRSAALIVRPLSDTAGWLRALLNNGSIAAGRVAGRPAQYAAGGYDRDIDQRMIDDEFSTSASIVRAAVNAL